MKGLVTLLIIWCTWLPLSAADTLRVYTSMDEAMQQPEAVQSLRLERQSFVVLPGEVTQLVNLEELSLSRCTQLNLENTFELLATLPRLRVLDISWIPVVDLPENISKLTALESLNLRDTRLVKLPRSFTQLVNLRHLNLRHNYYFNPEDVFRKLSRMEGLVSLDISYCQLWELPNELGALANLQSLNLEGNGLVSLPDGISKMSSLRELNLAANYQTGEVVGGVAADVTWRQEELFGLLAKCANLQVLDLTNCRLSVLSPAISRVTSLRSLDLSNNRLQELPEAVGKLPNIEVFRCTNPTMGNRTNQLRALPKSMANLSNLRVLDVTANEFTEFELPANHQWQQLEELHLGWNRLTSFPEAIRTMDGLKHLNLDINLITELPEWIGELSTLEVFHMNGDFFLPPAFKLKNIPAGLTRLANLRVLTLNDQVVEQLPADIGSLINLEVLEVRDNLLQALPASIGDLAALKSLDLKANEIRSLPPSINKLSSLEMLNMSFNLAFDGAIESRHLKGCGSLQRYDISFTLPLSGAQLTAIREELPGVTVVYAFTRR